MTESKIVAFLSVRAFTYQELWDETRIHRSILRKRLDDLVSRRVLVKHQYSMPFDEKCYRFFYTNTDKVKPNAKWKGHYYLLNSSNSEVKDIINFYYEHNVKGTGNKKVKDPRGIKSIKGEVRKRVEIIQQILERARAREILYEKGRFGNPSVCVAESILKELRQERVPMDIIRNAAMRFPWKYYDLNKTQLSKLTITQRNANKNESILRDVYLCETLRMMTLVLTEDGLLPKEENQYIKDNDTMNEIRKIVMFFSNLGYSILDILIRMTVDAVVLPRIPIDLYDYSNLREALELLKYHKVDT